MKKVVFILIVLVLVLVSCMPSTPQSRNYAYIADGLNGLVIVDITDPTNPSQAGHLDTYY
ncbi:MAG TPA: hypothetical protein DIT29_03905, partial [Pseudothermotoga sp.]|nr:hypothetical protein [Pseudothermotoga sp.]